MFKTPLTAGSRRAAAPGALFAAVLLLGAPVEGLAQALPQATFDSAAGQPTQAYPDPSMGSGDGRASGDPLGRPSPYSPDRTAYGQAPPRGPLPGPGAYSQPPYAQDPNRQAGSRYSGASQSPSYGPYPPAPYGAHQPSAPPAGYGHPPFGAYPQPRYDQGAAPSYAEGAYPPPPYAEPETPAYAQSYYGPPPTLPPRSFAGQTVPQYAPPYGATFALQFAPQGGPGSGGCGLPACGVVSPPSPCPVLCAVVAAPPHRHVAKRVRRHHKRVRRPCGCGVN